MLVRILGIVDLAVVLLILVYNYLPAKLILLGAFYLIIKGIIFIFAEDVASYADIAVGIYLVFMAFGLSLGVLTLISAVYLAQKGLLSLT